MPIRGGQPIEIVTEEQRDYSMGRAVGLCLRWTLKLESRGQRRVRADQCTEMNLTNFELRGSTQAIEVVSGNLNWDLHNFATFVGFRYDAAGGVFEIEWEADQVENPWGCPANRCGGCQLRFLGVKSVRITRDPANMMSDDSFCLHGVSKVEPLAKENRFKAEWQEHERFNLLFEFTSGWEVEVDASTAEFIPVARQASKSGVA